MPFGHPHGSSCLMRSRPWQSPRSSRPSWMVEGRGPSREAALSGFCWSSSAVATCTVPSCSRSHSRVMFHDHDSLLRSTASQVSLQRLRRGLVRVLVKPGIPVRLRGRRRRRRRRNEGSRTQSRLAHSDASLTMRPRSAVESETGHLQQTCKLNTDSGLRS